MSQQNVEIVKASFEAWNAADVAALQELYDPDVISRSPEGWPEPGASVGRNAVMRQFGQLRETWDTDAFEVIGDCIEAGDRVAVRCVWRGAGHGPELNLQMTCVFTVRKGRIFGVEFFWDHAEALELLGLSEQDVHGSDRPEV
jgi:ketosteroid isomerase-like protein